MKSSDTEINPARRRHVPRALSLFTALGGLLISSQLAGAQTGITIQNPSAVEGFLKNGERTIWYRVVNPQSTGIPLLLLHGGPGAPSYYLEPLEKLADERPVVLYDQFGCGRSSKPGPAYKWRVDIFANDLDALRRHLNLTRIHLLGHSWGTMLISAYLEGDPKGIESLTMVGPAFSAHRWVEDAARLRKQLPQETQDALAKHESTGTLDSKEYQAATMAYLKEHFCRLDPWPAALQKTSENLGPAYEAMWGPNEFVATGILKDFDKTAVLKTISVPTLLIGGEHDESTPETIKWYAGMIPGAKVVIIPDASHMVMLEQPTIFNNTVREFLRKVEKRQ